MFFCKTLETVHYVVNPLLSTNSTISKYTSIYMYICIPKALMFKVSSITVDRLNGIYIYHTPTDMKENADK